VECGAVCFVWDRENRNGNGARWTRCQSLVEVNLRTESMNCVSEEGYPETKVENFRSSVEFILYEYVLSLISRLLSAYYIHSHTSLPLKYFI
jgi:hypothetical protein